MALRTDRDNLSRFQNEHSGNIVEWRIILNEHARSKGEPHYFVYRIVEGPTGCPITEYLTRTGEVDGVCADGHFKDYAEIGMALILNHGRQQAAGFNSFYTEAHRNWMRRINEQPID